MSDCFELALNTADGEGHFPGNPMVPGVVLLARAFDAFVASGRGSLSPIGIRYARFRQIAVPGQRLMVLVRSDNDEHRVSIRRDEAVVADAVFVVGRRALDMAERKSPDAGRKPIGTIDKSIGEIDLDLLLPHRPPMRLVDGVLEEREDGIVCTARITPACALASHGRAPTLLGAEAAAQSAALWESLRRSRASGNPTHRLGYLVGLRDVQWRVRHIAAEKTFTVSARLTETAGELTRYAIEASCDDWWLLRGTIATMLVA